MTVQQLIEELQKLPPHYYVIVQNDEVGPFEVEAVEPAGDGCVVLEAE